ncbi:MAG: riboflavin biosynthesis protein RibF [Phycisphaerales bacterium]|jgi:riboflavin kinase/FMN adenylyltransferase|nr:riboflavin biosynthesis protein RibF [Phycisphaerales bacterium]
MSGTALIVGNFDGVHLGHAALAAAARAEIGKAGRLVALTFDPPPAEVLQPDAPKRRLMTLADRCDRLRAIGVDEVIVKEIDLRWLERTPEAFVQGDLLEHEPNVIVEGPDFRFGRHRAGDVELLTTLGRRHGFDVVVVPPQVGMLCNLEQVPIRSSTIRWLIERGRVRDAARLLGRPWTVEGSVVPGDRRGRTIGCPTANLDHGQVLLPADGVYAGRASVPGGVYAAAISVGTKPSFGHATRVLEAHVIDWDGPLDAYGWPLQVTVDRWLRDQVAFASVDALTEQIARDIDAARCVTATTPG